MCTLIVLHRCVDGAPLVAAANRDETLARPWREPALRLAGGRRVVAPLDCEAGGSWLGVNDAGVFVGILNRPAEPLDPERRSRGLLVMDALGAGSASEAAARLERLPHGAYNSFNLFVGDGIDAVAVVYEDAPSIVDLGAGAHVLWNGDPNDRSAPKVTRLLDGAERAAAAVPEQALDLLAALCRTHVSEGWRQSVCVHAGAHGTSSSTLLRLAAEPAASALAFAAGPPCTSPYEDFTHLLLDLGLPHRAAAGDAAMRSVI